MGIVNSSSTSLGLEGSGIIRNIGPDAEDMNVGDRVFVLGAGCFSTSVIASSQLCVRIPDSLSFEDASTMPCVFATVIYSLMDIGRLEKGQVIAPSISAPWIYANWK
jgi:NADPH:quinone reductase-like Zn-dependent oxidoreductase